MSTDDESISFWTLPPEIRNIIYQLVLEDADDDDEFEPMLVDMGLSHWSRPDLLNASRRIRFEASHHYYGCKIFNLRCYQDEDEGPHFQCYEIVDLARESDTARLQHLHFIVQEVLLRYPADTLAELAKEMQAGIRKRIPDDSLPVKIYHTEDDILYLAIDYDALGESHMYTTEQKERVIAIYKDGGITTELHAGRPTNPTALDPQWLVPPLILQSLRRHYFT